MSVNIGCKKIQSVHIHVVIYMQLYYVMHKNKVNLKIGNWNLFSQNFDVIKKSVIKFLIFSVMEHVDLKFT